MSVLLCTIGHLMYDVTDIVSYVSPRARSSLTGSSRSIMTHSALNLSRLGSSTLLAALRTLVILSLRKDLQFAEPPTVWVFMARKEQPDRTTHDARLHGDIRVRGARQTDNLLEDHST